MYGRVARHLAGAPILRPPTTLYAFLAAQIERAPRPARRTTSSRCCCSGDVDGRPYREDEMLDLCFFLLIAGLENTGLRHPRDAPPPRRAARPPRGRARRPVARPQPRSSSRCACTRPSRRCAARPRATPRWPASTIRGGRADAAAVRLGQPRRDGLRGRRRVPPRPPRRPPRRVRHRPAPLRRLAPRAPRDAHRGRGVPAAACPTSGSRPAPIPAGTRRARWTRVGRRRARRRA